MPASFSVNDTSLWPTLGETLQEMSRPKVITRETMGASVMARTLDRQGGMERTGAASRDQYLFGGVVAGKSMDRVISGNYVPRDAIVQSSDMRRGMLTGHLSPGNIIDTSV